MVAMYWRTLETALSFEKSIAVIVSNHLGYVIATRISDHDAPTQAMADMAKELLKAKS